jgi:hypothetical protein
MTTRKYSSRSQQTTLTSAITAGATTMVVNSATSLMGGATVTGTERFTVVIDPDTALEEIVDVSAVSTNTLTIARGVEVAGTGQAHSAGAVVRHMAIGRDYRESNLHIEATTAYNDGTATHDMHGIASGEGNVVGTLKTQTLTNKTLTSPTITGTGAIAGTFTGNLTGNVTGNVSGTAGSATGNAGSATVLATARDFQLTGDVEASAVSFNGSSAVNLVTSIATGSIVNADINASAAIDKTKISGTAITAGDTGTVTSTMILDGTILNADVNSAAIAYSKLALTGGVVNTDISNTAAISLGKLATDPLARANHTGTQTASTISDFDTQVRTSRLDQMAAPTASVALNSQKITGLGTPTANTTDAATTAYVDTSIANLIAGAPSTLNTLDEIAAALNDTANFSDTVVLKAGSTMTGALTLSGAPTVDLHAATKVICR